MLAGLFRLARPADWIKNVFVLVPVPFAIVAGAEFRLAPFALGLLAFCLVNSAVYTLNDLCDAEADRLHPKKRQRPIASGQVPGSVALIQAGVLLLAGMALCSAACAALGRIDAAWLLLVYVAVNLAYSLRAKHLALLDVFLLSSGFVIRVLLGCALVEAVPSAWLLLCTSSLAFFLGFTKRRADLLAGLDANHRGSLRGYSQAFLDQAITICAGIALVSYALYSIDSKVLVPGREMASMPFVAYGIFNYLRLANIANGGDSPVEIAYSSRSSQVCAVAWIVAVTWSLGIW
ncbi:MAG: UbiA prenyltransferase family protein [Pirellulales bacterium]|nr:UbiA prenyltransferase family protein [Pirellulales bacterium]